MAVSMTGYGRSCVSDAAGTVTLEIKTVNSRFLEINIRSEGVSPAMEELVRNCVKARIVRGKTSVFLKFSTADAGASVRAELNEPLLKAQVEALRQAGELPGIKKGKLTAADLLALPVSWICVTCDPVSDEVLEPLVRKAADEALAGLMAMREREGRNLAEDLQSRMTFLKEQLQFLKEKQPDIIQQYENRLRTRLQSLLDTMNIQTDEGRILEEVAVYAEKTDFTEEMVRFGSHLDQFCTALQTEGSIGRKLDFLLQELNREINTTASKANELEVVDCVIRIKTELEKVREQVQNIE